MRTLWAILLGGLALIGTAEARLGESKEQVIERYGQPITDEAGDPPFDRVLICKKDKYKFRIGFINDKAETITIISTEGLTEAEFEIFLKENSSGKGFKALEIMEALGFYPEGVKVKFYEEPDTKRDAIVLQDEYGVSLTVNSEAYLALMESRLFPKPPR